MLIDYTNFLRQEISMCTTLLFGRDKRQFVFNLNYIIFLIN